MISIEPVGFIILIYKSFLEVNPFQIPSAALLDLNPCVHFYLPCYQWTYSMPLTFPTPEQPLESPKRVDSQSRSNFLPLLNILPKTFPFVPHPYNFSKHPNSDP